MLTTVLLFICYAFFTQIRRPQAEPIWCGFEPLGREIQAEASSPIVVFEDLAAYHLWFAFRNDTPRPQVIKVQNFPGMPEDTAYFLPRGFADVQRVSADDLKSDQMWVVYRSSAYDPFSPPLYDLQGQGYEIVEQRTYDFGFQKLIGVLLRRKNQ